jgi:hypothetical protein
MFLLFFVIVTQRFTEKQKRKREEMRGRIGDVLERG